ncbi:MAG TPA: hypothetical protein VKH61_05715 [Streptosporangiaceae bacterium]|nr:hypothetical protein [Streptosporangiaceae bacterium]
MPAVVIMPAVVVVAVVVVVRIWNSLLARTHFAVRAGPGRVSAAT